MENLLQLEGQVIDPLRLELKRGLHEMGGQLGKCSGKADRQCRG